jgi:transcriptional regulator with XRE-family HTH domain
VTGYDAELIASADIQFGRRLRVLREERGVSQQALAAALAPLGITTWHQTTVGKIEAGSRAVRLTEALAVAELFATTVDELLEDPDSASARSHRSRELLARRSELALIEQMLRERERQLDEWLDAIQDGTDTPNSPSPPLTEVAEAVSADETRHDG